VGALRGQSNDSILLRDKSACAGFPHAYIDFGLSKVSRPGSVHTLFTKL